MSESLELPVKYICIFQRKSSKRTFRSYYRAILGVNILIDVVRCTWELSRSLRQWEQMELWDSSRLGFSPMQAHGWGGQTAGTLTFSMLMWEKLPHGKVSFLKSSGTILGLLSNKCLVRTDTNILLRERMKSVEQSKSCQGCLNLQQMQRSRVRALADRNSRSLMS